MAGTIKLTGKYEKMGEKALRDVVDILDLAGIPYVLEGGTLLGVIRENRLLPWDNDLDLTITRNNAKSLLKIRWKFWLKGYRTRIRTHRQSSDYFKKGSARILKIQTRKFFFFKDVSLIDIFIKDLKDGRYYWTVSDKKPVLKSVARHFYENISYYDFKGKSYRVPEDCDLYLENRYGDWRTPKTTWDFLTDDLSIEEKRSAAQVPQLELV